jgi:L-alanine-DL-glutamate epimerase-like enolase superfamily enzyme
VALYASGGYYLSGKGVDGLVEEVEAWVEAGFDRMKIKVGRMDLATEADRVRRVREAIGPNRVLMLDANNAWNSVDESVEFLRRVEEYDPYWIEEPFGPSDVAAHAHLASRTRTMVATGEQSTGLGEFEAFIKAKAADILQPDAAVCGGISEYLRICDYAASAGVGLAPHWFDSVHVHLVAATPISRFVEYFTDDSVFNFRRLLDRRMSVEGGTMRLPEADGIGFEFDDQICEKYAVQAWS